jgi:hypothetical protein
MTRTFRTLLGLAAVTVAASAAGAQTPQSPQDPQPQPRAERATTKDGAKAKRAKAPRRYRNVSRGEVYREGPHAVARDYYGADDPRCDDLCQRERMMDAKYGKDRERLPGARRGS